MQTQPRIPDPVMLSDLTPEQREHIEIYDSHAARQWRWKAGTPNHIKQSGVYAVAS